MANTSRISCFTYLFRIEPMTTLISSSAKFCPMQFLYQAERNIIMTVYTYTYMHIVASGTSQHFETMIKMPIIIRTLFESQK